MTDKVEVKKTDTQRFEKSQRGFNKILHSEMKNSRKWINLNREPIKLIVRKKNTECCTFKIKECQNLTTDNKEIMRFNDAK